MTRDEALNLLENHIHADNLKNHCLATEAIMQQLAEKLERDEKLWRLAGLLHDLDFEYTRDEPAQHGKKTAELLAPYGLPAEVINAILRHNAEALGLERQTTMDYALTCAETITGLIVAAALVHPDKKIQSLKPKSVRKRMKSKDFARSVNRDHIMLCEHLNIPLMDFIELSIHAMNSISDQIGL
ncbi:HDIG domain-containing metalloprotein [Desulfoferrobacter suflitae]|uniref:HDIG domain-containing metalloprotein n=1 Tax=Desulfoferrobacter suflitae TaxID=2865782 RepID=UPI0021645D1C|nr:HDIG domain-containing metalloprotein [Desulfoferrobacter suflitae]MCK8603082.1 HDIG domain-containing protein [Desulfoferrobacter suflitae]